MLYTQVNLRHLECEVGVNIYSLCVIMSRESNIKLQSKMVEVAAKYLLYVIFSHELLGKSFHSMQRCVQCLGDAIWAMQRYAEREWRYLII